jgi:hypothetical protein
MIGATVAYEPLPQVERITPAGLGRMAQVLATRTLWERMVRFDSGERWYARLAGGDGWEAWLLTWLPGQGTGLHTHGPSSGAFTVIQGELRESALVSPLDSDDPARFSHRTLTVGALRTFGPGYAHDVDHSGDGPAVSLHVYGPALTTMTRFDLDAAGRLRARVTERAGVDW